MSGFTRMRIDWQPCMLSVTRIMLGLLLLEHGLSKLFDFPHQPNHQPFNLLTLNPGAQGLIELIGGALLVLGLFTRPVAFVLAGDMAAAYFIAHAPRGFFPLLNGGELAIVYCFAFLYFWVAGAGLWGLDRLRAPARISREPARADEEIVAEGWRVRRADREIEPAHSGGRDSSRRRQDAPGSLGRENR